MPNFGVYNLIFFLFVLFYFRYLDFIVFFELFLQINIRIPLIQWVLEQHTLRLISKLLLKDIMHGCDIILLLQPHSLLLTYLWFLKSLQLLLLNHISSLIDIHTLKHALHEEVLLILLLLEVHLVQLELLKFHLLFLELCQLANLGGQFLKLILECFIIFLRRQLRFFRGWK